MPSWLLDAFRAGKVADVPFMIGGTDWEASVMDFARTDPAGARLLRAVGSTPAGSRFSDVHT